jgi:hypothetical protein
VIQYFVCRACRSKQCQLIVQSDAGVAHPEGCTFGSISSWEDRASVGVKKEKVL